MTVAGDDQIRVLILVGAVADAHGDFDRCVGAHDPPALPEQGQVLGRGPHLKAETPLGVVRFVPVDRHPHVDIAQPGKGGLVKNVECHFIASGRMPADIG